MRRAVAALVGVVLVSGCGGGEEPEQEVAVEAADIPDYEVIEDDGRLIELLSDGVDAEGAEAIIDQVIAKSSSEWEGEHNIQVVDDPGAGMVVCRARWVEDEQSSQTLTGGSVTPEDGEWPAVEMNCFE
ncbi:hypothetical protein ACFW4K_26760 [Nocardiopsis alba]|uniref:hypothetical protein n=1 Tax=Nocardiopsis alba TaxID=53437 RepID=UPI00366AE0DF